MKDGSRSIFGRLCCCRVGMIEGGGESCRRLMGEGESGVVGVDIEGD